MISFFYGVVSIFFTILVYIGVRKLYERFRYPFTFPLLVATIFIVSVLLVFNISYETYSIGGQWLEKLLGPAVVALAYPLYKQLQMLKEYALPVGAAVLIGSITGMLSGLWLAKWFGYEKQIIYSMLPKSVTTPVAMEVSKAIGGIPALAVIFVMIAGLGGVVLAPYCFKLFKITNKMAKGVGTGTASHAIGTAKALENSEREGAASSVAMTLSAIIVSIMGPLFVTLFY